MLIPPFFLDTVVAIGFTNAKGQTQWAATGFLFGRFIEQKAPDQKRYQIVLVTNKHVVGDRAKARVRFNPEGDQPAREFDLDLRDAKDAPLWHGHTDPDVDVAVVKINVRFLKEQGIRFSYFQSDAHILERKKAADLGVAEGDGVFALGFPLGLVGETRSVVVVRQGILARVSDCLVGHQKDFLIDATVFPGNSGGPVVLRPEVTAIDGTKAVSSAYLLGVVSAYVPYNDVAVSAQTQQPRVIFQENSGLASVYPVDYILEILGSLPKPEEKSED